MSFFIQTERLNRSESVTTANPGPFGRSKDERRFRTIGLLVATGELDSAAVAGCGFVGELSLDGAATDV